MRFLRYLPLAALVLAGACDKAAKVTDVARPPLAYIRYVNAVPDAGALDFKFMDAVEYSPSYANAGFRSVGIYQGARAGARPIKVFRNSSDIAVTQVALIDQTLNLTAGTYYTLLHTGTLASSQLVVIEDALPNQDGGIHVGVVNGTNAARDVFVGAPAGTPTFGNIAAGTRRAYAARALGAFTLHATTVGSLTSLGSVTPIAGVAGTVSADPVGGHSVAGTQFSMFVFQTAPFAIVVDRQPPRTVPD